MYNDVSHSDVMECMSHVVISTELLLDLCNFHNWNTKFQSDFIPFAGSFLHRSSLFWLHIMEQNVIKLNR